MPPVVSCPRGHNIRVQISVAVADIIAARKGRERGQPIAVATFVELVGLFEFDHVVERFRLIGIVFD